MPANTRPILHPKVKIDIADGARDAVHEDLSDLIQEHALPIEVAGLLSSALARELAGCILSGVSLAEVQEIYRELGREVDLYVERIAAFGAE
ncbi:hypothetical protein [Cognatishimia sp. MH4019]|uniref:hypothetical protein n=1 Tax=Cognatishimia sp. MH4019 TaxID=2854030 RepID=UPI001CD672D1|nr:hypothetical protein [Cognatishimia sp. MH4019]